MVGHPFLKGGCTMKNNFYLSRILGNKVYTKDMKVIGRLSDLGVINELKKPSGNYCKSKN